jgi:hypothetical protein
MREEGFVAERGKGAVEEGEWCEVGRAWREECSLL